MEFSSNLVMTFAIACGILGVVYALYIAAWVNKQDAGNEKMKQISDAVKEGAYAFLAREYKTVAVVAVVLFIIQLFANADDHITQELTFSKTFANSEEKDVAPVHAWSNRFEPFSNLFIPPVH